MGEAPRSHPSPLAQPPHAVAIAAGGCSSPRHREAAGRGDPVRGVVVHRRLAGRAPRLFSGAATGLPRRPAASSQ